MQDTLADPLMAPAEGSQPVMGRDKWGMDYEMFPAAGGGWCGVVGAREVEPGRHDRMRWWMPQEAGDEARERYMSAVAGEGEV